jgi:protein O-GlcNAc transferase
MTDHEAPPMENHPDAAPGTSSLYLEGEKHHRAGRLQDAQRCYLDVTASDPGNADAWHMAGVVAGQLGNNPEGIQLIRRAIELQPGQSMFHYNLGLLLARQRNQERARDSFQKAIHLKPDFALAHASLGASLRDLGQPLDALAHLNEAVRLRPDLWSARLHIAAVQRSLGHTADAIASYMYVTQAQPDNGAVQMRLAELLLDQGRKREAAEHLEQAVRTRPLHAPTLNRLGDLLLAAGRPARAVDCYQESLRLAPAQIEVLNNLGIALKQCGRIRDAVETYQRALKITPNSPEIYANMGIALTAAGQTAKAIECYERALRHNPNFAEMHRLIGDLYKTEGDARKASEHYLHKLRIEPDDLTRVCLATVLPAVYESEDDLKDWRARFEDNVDRLVDAGVRVDPMKDVMPSTFYLAYQGYNDREVLQKLAMVYGPLPADLPPASASPSRDGRIRVGFLSRYLRDHTLGRFNGGVITNLSRERFEVTILSLGHYEDAIAQAIRGRADRYLVLPEEVGAARQALASVGLDALIFSGIGMDPLTYSLAYSRAAPVQCATWGHPVTSGTPAMDYYLSSELYEPDDPADHYSETLVRFHSLNTYYFRPALPEPRLARADYGLDADAHIYFCPQTLFKFHPDFDELLGEILRGDPGGRLLLLDTEQKMKDALMRRFTRTIPDVIGRIRFIGQLPHAKFVNLMALSDVMIDTTHFSGSNTSLEAIAVGTPVVTLPSPFRRGRFTAGYYRKMNVIDTIAEDREDYVRIALRLGTEPEYRKTISDKILAGGDHIFEDMESVRELEAFLERAVAQARDR